MRECTLYGTDYQITLKNRTSPELYPFIYCLTILGVFYDAPSGFIVVPFCAYFSALFMQLLCASFRVLLYIKKF